MRKHLHVFVFSAIYILLFSKYLAGNWNKADWSPIPGLFIAVNIIALLTGFGIFPVGLFMARRSSAPYRGIAVMMFKYGPIGGFIMSGLNFAFTGDPNALCAVTVCFGWIAGNHLITMMPWVQDKSPAN